MSKDQKPLRGIRDELFDVDQPYKERAVLAQAYQDFWKTLDEDTRLELDSMLG